MQEKRRYVRFPASGTCRIREGNIESPGQLVDLSLGGVQIRTGSLVSDDQTIRMTLELESLPGGNVIGANGTVVRAPGGAVGVRFDGVDSISGRRLEHWVGQQHENPEQFQAELDDLRSKGRIVTG